ncbi:hypothetical protein DBR46_02645 [Pseudomonas sp. KBW05]|nr:hypothetical protein DBR46_02645 [Pseudomonas sp. KBW05]
MPWSEGRGEIPHWVKIQMWERACSRMRCVSQHMYQLIHRIREQARSHTSPLPQGICGVLTLGVRV